MALERNASEQTMVDASEDFKYFGKSFVDNIDRLKDSIPDTPLGTTLFGNESQKPKDNPDVGGVADWVATNIPDPRQQIDRKIVATRMREALVNMTENLRDLFGQIAAKWKAALNETKRGEVAPLATLMQDPVHRMEAPAFLVMVPTFGQQPNAQSLARVTTWMMELPTDQRARLREDLIVGGLVDSRETYQHGMEMMFGPGTYDPMEDYEGVLPVERNQDSTTVRWVGETEHLRSVATQHRALAQVGSSHMLLEKANELYDQRRLQTREGLPLTPTMGELGTKAYAMAVIVPKGSSAQTMGLSDKEARDLEYGFGEDLWSERDSKGTTVGALSKVENLHARHPELRDISVPQTGGAKAEANMRRFEEANLEISEDTQFV